MSITANTRTDMLQIHMTKGAADRCTREQLVAITGLIGSVGSIIVTTEAPFIVPVGHVGYRLQYDEFGTVRTSYGTIGPDGRVHG